MKKLSLLVLLLTLSAPAIAATGLPFIHDNSAKALVEAKQRKLPLFVEVGAPW